MKEDHVAMPHHEFSPNPSEFAQLEQSVSDELLRNRDVLTLCKHSLAKNGFANDRSDLAIRPFYDPMLSAGIEALGLRRTEVVPMSLQIKIPVPSIWGGDPHTSYEFAYVKLGVTTDDELQSYVYDNYGRLRERLDVIEGDSIEKCRVLAVPAWKAAHHAMLNASLRNPAIRLDRVQGIWTDTPPEDYIEFHLQ